MNINLRLIIKICIIVVLSLAVISFLYNRFGYGSLAISGSNKYDRVLIDGKDYTAALNRHTIRLRPGKYTIEAYSKRYEPHVSSVSIEIFSKESVEITSGALDMKNRVEQLVSRRAAGQFKVKDGVFLENDTWYVTSLTTVDDKPLDATFILQYGDRGWDLYQSGTAFSSTALPRSVKSYLEMGL